MQNTFFYFLLMLVAGLGIPTMASLNAGLGGKLQSPFLAVAILLVVALTTASFLVLMTQGMPKSIYAEGTPWYLYCGGFLFVLYISSVTWVIPKFGVANAIGVVLLGRLIAMTVIDHYGLFGLVKYEITLKRFLGLVFMALGIFLVVSKQK
jgi:transporter family-2 protein